MTMGRVGWAWVRRAVLLGAGLVSGCQQRSEDAVPAPDPTDPAPVQTAPESRDTSSPPLPSGPPPARDPDPAPPSQQPPGSPPRRTQRLASFYESGAPTGLAVGDFNGDGAPEVVVRTEGSNYWGRYASRWGSLRVWRNDGRGGLLPPLERHEVSGASLPSVLVAEDVNGDGRRDVLVSSRSGSPVLLGQGTGALVRQYGGVGGEATNSMGVWKDRTGAALLWTLSIDNGWGLFDDDGPSFWMGRVLPDGKLKQWQPLPEDFSLNGGHWYATSLFATVADFNEDGLADVVFSQPQAVPPARQAQVFLGQGEQLVPEETRSVLPEFRRMLTADLNRDGHVDLLGLVFEERSLKVFLGNGQGSFSPGPTVPLKADVGELALMDLDADGLLDVAVSHPWASAVSVLRGRGNGDFTVAGLLAVGRGPWGMAAADLDRDGLPELVVAEAADNTVSVYSVFLGDLPSSPPAPLTCPLNATAADPLPLPAVSPLAHMDPEGIALEGAAGDFDADGRMDLALTLSQGGVRLLFHERDGQFVTHDIDSTRGAIVTSLVAGDFDGDGRADLAGVFPPPPDRSAFRARVLWNEGESVFSLAPELGLWLGTFRFLAEDFNQDGRMDLALSTESGGVSVSRLMSLGQRQFSSMGLPDYNPSSDDDVYQPDLRMLAGDFNRDGTRDLLYWGEKGLNLVPTGRDGSSLPGHGFGGSWSSESVAVGDADGDGVADLLSHGQWLSLGDGRGSLRGSLECQLPQRGQVVAWQDVNADGLEDVLTFDQQGAGGGTLWVMLRAPGGKWGAQRPYPLGSELLWARPVDLQGDARPELAVLLQGGHLLLFPTPGP